jgi:hypothetical protein
MDKMKLQEFINKLTELQLAGKFGNPDIVMSVMGTVIPIGDVKDVYPDDKNNRVIAILEAGGLE